jgi:hypothetical protein
MAKAKTGKTIERRSLTANQVVAANIEAARKRKRWTQFWMVKELSKFGVRWSRENYAMSIPTSAKGTRIREFNADEILAFAQALDIAIWTLFIPPLDTTVRLPGGGPTLDLQAMRHFAYEATERPAPKTQREAELQKEVDQNLMDYIFEKLGIKPGKPAQYIPSAAQISEMAEEAGQVIERTRKRGQPIRKKDR